MTIQKMNYNWNGSLTKRKITTEAIIHHMAGEGSALDIHRIHLNNGWVGIGYHFYVRLDGTICEGRPINMIGAHTTGRNSSAIGICFEGNYETRTTMPSAQLKAGRELIAHIRKLYPNITFAKHRDYNATACPGKNFEFDIISKGVVSPTQPSELTSVNDIVWELNHRGIITDKELWLKKLNEDVNVYWLARKCVNMTVNR